MARPRPDVGQASACKRASARFALTLLLALLPTLSAQPREPITALAFSPDGRLLASSGDREVVLWDTASSRIQRRLPGLSGRVRALAFSPDALQLAVAEGVPGRSGELALLDLATGSPTSLRQSQDEMLAVAFSPDGRLLATGGTDAIVRIFSLPAPATPRELKGHTGWISSLAFSPDGKLLATGSADQTVRIFNPATWEEMFLLPQSPAGPVTALAFSLESDMLAFTVNGADERAVRIWRTQGIFAEPDPTRPNARAALAQTRPVDQGTCPPLAIAFFKAPQHSRMIEGCADNTVRFLAQGGNSIATGAGHTDWVYAVAASPDGSRLASGSGDGSIKIWNAAGKLLATLTEGATHP